MKKLIILFLCSSLLVACGKKGYPPPEKLSTKEITDILVKELGAERVDSMRTVTWSFCGSYGKTQEEINECKEKRGAIWEREWREDAVREYKRNILNVLTD